MEGQSPSPILLTVEISCGCYEEQVSGQYRKKRKSKELTLKASLFGLPIRETQGRLAPC